MASIDTSASLQSESQRASGFGSLSSDEFTEIILAELSNQDPLEPNDTNALLEQLSSIRAIESDTRLAESLESLVSRDEFAIASGLIGKVVTAEGFDGPVVDTVFSVSQNADGVRLNLNGGRSIGLDDVREVSDIEQLSAGVLGGAADVDDEDETNEDETNGEAP